MRRKTLKLGFSDYKQFIENNGYFVDKTLLIQEVIDNVYQTVVLPRPRRFGKTFNLSMLRYFFDVRLKNTAHLFEPYKIWQTEDYYTQQQGKHPVIHLSLKRAKGKTFEQCREELYGILTNVYKENIWLLEEGHLSDFDKDDFVSILNRSASDRIYKESLQKLSQYLCKHFGKETLVLIDEYDAAIHQGFQYGYYSEIVEIMKALLGNVLKDNVYLYRGVITGILRISKESIFSDVNNIGVFSLLNFEFGDKFGFTELETKELLQYFDLKEKFSQVKEWYDGYQMGEVKNIYNPWSVVNYAARYREGFQTYWVNTSSDALIKQRIADKDNHIIRREISQLLKGKSIKKDIDPNIVFDQWERNKNLLWQLLVFSGYLAVDKKVKLTEYYVKIPNYEIKILFQKILLEWLELYVQIRKETLEAVTKSLISNKIPTFKRQFKKLMSDTFSFFDTHTEAERVYHAYLLGILTILGDDYVIKSNRESGDGRYDILLLPHKKNKYGVVIEVKALEKEASEKQVKKELVDALQQIRKNKYYKELESHDIQKRVELAMVFAGKEVYMEAN